MADQLQQELLKRKLATAELEDILKPLATEGGLPPREGLPPVRPPSIFRPDPFVTNPELGKRLAAIKKFAPDADIGLNVITPGFTRGLISAIVRQNKPEFLNEPGGLNLTGMHSQYTDTGKKDIFVDPDLDIGTLVHELAHNVGHNNEEVPTKAHTLADRIWPEQRSSEELLMDELNKLIATRKK